MSHSFEPDMSLERAEPVALAGNLPGLFEAAGLVETPGWRIYLSFADELPAGCGAMRVVDGVAWLDWAATLPEYRRRRSRQLIMAQRIADARRLGCRSLATCTGEALPGEPQYSYRNIMRAGFRKSHTRENWVPKRG